MNIPCNTELNSKTAVITGGGGVLCSAMAKALAACGAKTALLNRNIAPTEEIVRKINEAGGTAIAVSCDITDKASLIKAREIVESQLGPASILINGAGGNHPKGTAEKEQLPAVDCQEDLSGSFFDMNTEGLDFVFRLNYTGTVLATQVFAESMAKTGSGSVINISSMSANRPLTKVLAYSNAKAAVNSFTEWLAVHLAPTGVRVNAIAPGFFLTSQNRDLLMDKENHPTERCRKILANTPMGRLGSPDELLGAMLFLADVRASGFVTGTVIPVDGGFSAFSGV